MGNLVFFVFGPSGKRAVGIRARSIKKRRFSDGLCRWFRKKLTVARTLPFVVQPHVY
jgi:hypothetical protein